MNSGMTQYYIDEAEKLIKEAGELKIRLFKAESETINMQIALDRVRTSLYTKICMTEEVLLWAKKTAANGSTLFDAIPTKGKEDGK